MDEAMVSVIGRGALADRDRNRLLRRHPRLPGAVRGAARPRVDGALTRWCGSSPTSSRSRAAARAPRGDPAAERGWHDALEEARAPPSDSSRPGIRGRPRLLPASGARRAAGRLRRCGSGRIETRARTGGSPSRGSRSCGWRRAGAMPRSLRSAAAQRRPRPAEASAMFPAYVEIMLAAADVGRGASRVRGAEALAAAVRERDAGRARRLLAGSGRARRGRRAAALTHLRGAIRTWRSSSSVRGRAHPRADRARVQRPRRRRRGRARARSRAHCLRGLGAAPDVARVDSVLEAGKRADTHGLTAREVEVLRLVAAGRTTARSPPRSSSASTPSRGTCRTSSRSSACPRGRRRRRSRSSTTSSDSSGQK